MWQICSKDSRIEFACFSFHVGLLFVNFLSLNWTPKITSILTLYQANAATLMPFSKEGTILIQKISINVKAVYNIVSR